jgi:hypothetical protein
MRRRKYMVENFLVWFLGPLIAKGLIVVVVMTILIIFYTWMIRGSLK